MQTTVRSLPPGTIPPLVIQYSASSTPIVQLGISSKTMPEQQLFDLGQNFIRSQLATVPGAATPYPYGGKVRQVQVDLDLPRTGIARPVAHRHRQRGQRAERDHSLGHRQDRLAGISGGDEQRSADHRRAERPAGQDQNGSTIYLREVAHVRDGFAPQTNIVRQDGVRGVLMSIYKTGSASTITIVQAVKNMVPIALQTLPPGVTVKPLFDQSLFVRASINGVLREGLTAAALTAAMILLFLGDWRPTIVISISIPLSIFVSVLLLSALGETINIMTLGGLALAVGILVDDATVEIENIERNLAQGKEMRQAILDGAQQIAVPAFVSTLSICIVFVPMFFLTGVARYLFVPLAEAVVFAMLASYFLSRTLIPTLVMYIMRGHEHQAQPDPRRFSAASSAALSAASNASATAITSLLETTLEHRKVFAPCFICVLRRCPWAGVLPGPGLLSHRRRRLDAPARARPRRPARGRNGASCATRSNSILRTQIPKDELVTILDNIGLPYSGINLSYAIQASSAPATRRSWSA